MSFGAQINESRTARKLHVCCECEEPINSGERYQYYKTAFLDDDGKFCWREYKSHAACYEKILAEAAEEYADYVDEHQEMIDRSF